MEKNWGGRNGIEPSSPGWSPGALPWLCYSRIRIVSTDAPRYCMVVVLSTRRNVYTRGHPERSRFSGGAKDLLLHRPVARPQSSRIWLPPHLGRASPSLTSSDCPLLPIHGPTPQSPLQPRGAHA